MFELWPITQISTDIDYQLEGKQQDYLRVPYSSNKFGWAQPPDSHQVVKNGQAPRRAFAGRNHGDELKGPCGPDGNSGAPIRPEDVSGCLILIPALNLPAVLAGTRLSPIDGVNLNRAFPGKYTDTVTGLIAHYLTQVLFPLADVVMDLHSGGKSMDFFPCAHLHRVGDDAQFRKCWQLPKFWECPMSLSTLISRAKVCPCRPRAWAKSW